MCPSNVPFLILDVQYGGCVSQHGTLDSCGLNSPEWIAARRAQCTPLCTEAENSYCLACFLPITHIHHGLEKSVPLLGQDLGVLQLWILFLSADWLCFKLQRAHSSLLVSGVFAAVDIIGLSNKQNFVKTFSDIARKNNDCNHKVSTVFNCKIWIEAEKSSSSIFQIFIFQ